MSDRLCTPCWFLACKESTPSPCLGRATKGGDCMCSCRSITIPVRGAEQHTTQEDHHA